jgi:hypothetical protein
MFFSCEYFVLYVQVEASETTSFLFGRSSMECVRVSFSVIRRNNRPVYLQIIKYEDVRLKKFSITHS